MSKVKACILDQRNSTHRTALSIGFEESSGPTEDLFAELPEVLLDVPHEVFRGMDTKRSRSRVEAYWLARSWGES
ncbi:MAG: hypothetical protein KC933_19400 [Myxococcales bacterium]|nr:hypothetical protein [Myxococcales bacterium]MCB9647633.1 hypothetical protein [Deltaproteobacteria bacterium]